MESLCERDSFRFPQGFEVDEANRRIKFPKMGWVRYRQGRGKSARKLQGEVRSSFATACQTQETCGVSRGILGIHAGEQVKSIIRRSKFAGRYGIFVHGSAALVIARRAFQFSERPNP